MVEIIAEIGSNWMGDVSLAKSMMYECKEAGVNTVKFQMWKAEDLYTKDHPNWDAIKESELTFEKAETLKEYADNNDILWFCSPFYPEAIPFLEKLNVKLYKLASQTTYTKYEKSIDVLKAITNTNKPVIASIGDNFDQLHLFFNIKHFIIMKFLYTIPKYPATVQDINIKTLLHANGYSNHIPDPAVCLAVVAFSRDPSFILETHVKPGCSGRHTASPDASSSITLSELKWLINKIRKIEGKIGC